MEKSGIIILNYNTLKETNECINSIRRYTSVPYHIYIIDNDSDDGSGIELEKIYQNDKDTTVILNRKNGGYSAGNNVGIRQAIKDSCRYIFIVNSDVELLNDAFSIMIQTLKEDSRIMMVGPSVMDLNNQESQLPREKLNFKTFILERHPFCYIPLFKKKAYRKIDINVDNPTIFRGSVSGCCFCIKSEDFAKIDFLDEREFLYYEEDTLAYKMDSINKYAAVEKRAKVLHKANISTNKKGNAFVQYHRWLSVLYMLKRYAKINEGEQFFVALWNTLTWDILSIKSKNYRKMRKSFSEKNWSIVKEKFNE